MVFLDKDQLERINAIIKRYTDWYKRRILGPTYTEKPSNIKIDETKLTPMDRSVIELSFELGINEAVLKESEWKDYSWDALQESKKPLTPIQKLQIEASELSMNSKFRRLGEDITSGLYDKLAQATSKVVSEAQVKGIIHDKIKVGVEANRAYYDVAHDLVGDLKEQQRNWARVASTEMHAARQNGIASAIATGTDFYEDADGVESDVAVTLAPDACKDCNRIYIDEATGHPKIFKLVELLKNTGTNYQRPWRENAKPVIPPLHPSCHCRIRYVPPGWGWNEKGRFTLVDPDKAFPEKEVKKAIDTEPHSLLHASHAVLPEESYIQGLKGPHGLEELGHLIPRLRKLYYLYIREPFGKKIKDLLDTAQAKHFHETVAQKRLKGTKNAV